MRRWLANGAIFSCSLSPPTISHFPPLPTFHPAIVDSKLKSSLFFTVEASQSLNDTFGAPQAHIKLATFQPQALSCLVVPPANTSKSFLKSNTQSHEETGGLAVALCFRAAQGAREKDHTFIYRPMERLLPEVSFPVSKLTKSFAVYDLTNNAVDLSYQYHHHYNIGFIATGPFPRTTMQNWVIPLVHRFVDFTASGENKLKFAMYCASVASLLPGPRHLAYRLGLVPVFAIPFLAVPRLLFPCATIILVDVTGERRPMPLDLWRDAKAFVEELWEIFDGNQAITSIILSHQYRIQNCECSVYRLGSRQVTAGTEIFMAAMVYGDSAKMECPYCKTEVHVSAGHNLDASIDCDHCRRRFSTSLSRSPESPGPTASSEASDGTLQTPSAPDTALFKIVHLVLYPQVRRMPSSQGEAEGFNYVDIYDRAGGLRRINIIHLPSEAIPCATASI
ncbi:hypothetical protein R3P38DRAFT_3201748 [Favolaschia claudopus]|uniref:Uncharacterized protein n=1 Tax=Favolaschia claudopus TaxID=2862362 RepID=A0AAW0AW89_9AGAR